MTSRTEEYLERASRYPRRAWEQGEDWLSRIPEAAPEKPSAVTIACLAGLAICVAAGVYYGADLVRYMNMRRM